MRERKNIRNLSENEVQRFRLAFEKMYADPEKTYQSFAGILLNFGHASQNDMDFLTWNRAFFLQFELYLLEQDEALFLPYWDYTEKESIDSGLPDILTAPTYRAAEGQEKPNPLARGFSEFALQTYRETGSSRRLSIPRKIANKALKTTSYADYSLTYFLADVSAHIWVGGSMVDLQASPYDPLFWFLHCNLDRYWNKWQRGFDDLGKSTMWKTVLSANLSPFKNNKKNLTGESVLDILNLGYDYPPEQAGY